MKNVCSICQSPELKYHRVKHGLNYRSHWHKYTKTTCALLNPESLELTSNKKQGETMNKELSLLTENSVFLCDNMDCLAALLIMETGQDLEDTIAFKKIIMKEK